MDEEPSLDERLSILLGLCADPAAGEDLPELTGLLGHARLELYERDSSAEVLDAAIGTFQAALALAPAHDLAPSWYGGLGVAFSHRAVRTGEARDYDQAVEWLQRLYEALPDSDPDRDFAGLLLVEALWDRFYDVHYGEAPDAAVALRLARDVTQAIAGITLDDDLYAAYSELVLGLANLACFDESGDRDDLAAGIRRLTAAVDSLPADTPRFLFATSWLVEALRSRAALEGDATGLDLAIAIGERVLASSTPDQPHWAMLNCFQAGVYDARWRAAHDQTDLDDAIDHWRSAFDQTGLAWAARNCGDLLAERAELLQEATGLPEAIRLLDLAASESADDDPESSRIWLQLGLAHHLHWTLTQEPACLSHAAASFDRSLALPSPGPDVTLFIHNQRLATLVAALQHESTQPHTEQLPAARRLRAGLQQAQASLSQAENASPDMRAMTAMLMAYSEMYAIAHEMEDLDLDRIRELITLGARLSEPPPEWQSVVDTARGLLQVADSAVTPTRLEPAGVDEMMRVITAQQVDGVTDVARRVLPMILQMRTAQTGDLRTQRAAGVLRWPAAPGGAWNPPEPDDPEGDALALVLEAVEHSRRGDFAAAAALAQQATAIVQRLPDSFSKARLLDPFSRFLNIVLSLINGQPTDDDPLPEIAPGKVPAAFEVASLLITAAARQATAQAGSDLATLRNRVAKMTELAALAADGTPTRFAAIGMAGTGEMEVVRRDPSDMAAASRAVAAFETMATAFTPEAPVWTIIMLNLATSLRLARHGDLARTRRLGMAALHSHSRQVLLQSGTDLAIETARVAAADAHRVAGWCLQDRAYEEAIAALDAGRGLVLRAATTSRQMAELLIDAGHPDLAQEWLTSAGLGRDHLSGDPLPATAGGIEVPDDLRLRVLRALDAGTAGSAITKLGSVGLADIRAALHAVDADALVYLIPASDRCPGTALVVAASGPVECLDLPDLHIDAGSSIEGHVRSLGSLRDLAPAGPSSTDRLDELCRWAWSAAMGRLLGHVQSWRLARPARLVLVPMGALAMVPWHAACRATEHGLRYAVQDLVVSYGVSAQMFCATAAHPNQSSQSALIVGNPLGDLPFAGTEAQSIHRQFHPNGSYLGFPAEHADGPGTPQEVLDWLASTASGPSTLHFACHAKVDTLRPADGHLALAGGTLTARRLLEVSSLAALVINRAFLAACTTNVTGADHDEAFSLATAFLAAGAHTVFGSLWPVPDEDTSVLMYMVHHHLHTGSCSPADALHRAQLWMLDPGRQPPPMMPPELARSVTRKACADPVSWAAFTHLGR